MGGRWALRRVKPRELLSRRPGAALVLGVSGRLGQAPARILSRLRAEVASTYFRFAQALVRASQPRKADTATGRTTSAPGKAHRRHGRSTHHRRQPEQERTRVRIPASPSAAHQDRSKRKNRRTGDPDKPEGRKRTAVGTAPATQGVRLHDLRHAFAVAQLMAGVHYMQVSRWQGDSTLTLSSPGGPPRQHRQDSDDQPRSAWAARG